MKENNLYDVIIIGGSYSGLAAAMALGRALRKVLVIDGGEPCNRQTPHSHNFLTQDGKTPGEITVLGKKQVQQYRTIQFLKGLAIEAVKTNTGFDVITDTGKLFYARKIILATGKKIYYPIFQASLKAGAYLFCTVHIATDTK